jgi:hypothetical protein
MRTCIICRKYDSINKFREGKFLYRVCNDCELNYHLSLAHIAYDLECSETLIKKIWNANKHLFIKGFDYDYKYYNTKVFKFIKSEVYNRSKGFIYFAVCELSGLVKIGKTKDKPKIRFNRIQSCSPTKLKFFYFRVNGFHRYELSLHHKYSEYRIHGEWFNIPNLEELKQADMSYVTTNS